MYVARKIETAPPPYLGPNFVKQSLVLCPFHSVRMTTADFFYPTHCLLKVCFSVEGAFETQLLQNKAWNQSQ